MLAWRARDASSMLFFVLWGMVYWLSSRGALATKDLDEHIYGRFYYPKTLKFRKSHNIFGIDSKNILTFLELVKNLTIFAFYKIERSYDN